MTGSNFLSRRNKAAKGFTLIEVVVVVAMMGIIGAITAPELFRWIHRSKVLGFGRTLTTVIVKARLEAIRKGRLVCIDYEETRAIARLDCDDPDAEEVGEAILPSYLGYDSPMGESVVDGFEILPPPAMARIVFNPDGSVEAVGAVRFGDDRPTRNYFEMWVGPARAAPKVKLRKWDDGVSEWYAKGEGARFGGWTWH